MFGTGLRYFYCAVACIAYILRNSVYLIAEYKGVAFVGLYGEIVQHCGAFGLFNGEYFIAFVVKRADGIESICNMLPCDCVLGSQSCLVYFACRRGACDTQKPQTFYGKVIACSEV